LTAWFGFGKGVGHLVPEKQIETEGLGNVRENAAEPRRNQERADRGRDEIPGINPPHSLRKIPTKRLGAFERLRDEEPADDEKRHHGEIPRVVDSIQQ
jgi:hypothetical protein